MIILLFGQTASGKTTLAEKLYSLKFTARLNFIRIDGDKWRDVTKNNDYSKQGRINNLKGAFNMALYLEKDGFNSILSFVTPYIELRDYLNDGCTEVFQVYLKYSGDRGRNNYFVSDFEEPTNCLILDTSLFNIDECIQKIIKYIYMKKFK